MYTLIREHLPSFGPSEWSAGKRAARPVSSTVILLGLTSLVTDISSEMVTTVLPLYFIFHLGLTPLSFGIIDGLYQGVSAPLRILGGYAADRLRLHKATATAGYSISAVCKLGLFLFGGALLPFVSILMVDRAGKGLRTAPRDAMISLSAPRGSLGLAFGVHRAMDTAGAIGGPLLAFALLELAPFEFDMIFMVSFCIALIGVTIIGLLVQSPDSAPSAISEAQPRPSMADALRLLVRPSFRRIVPVAGALSVFTISDGFFYLLLQRRMDIDFGFFPLLFVGTAVSYFILAIPAGMLADRFGRMPVLVGGYLLLLAAYTVLLRPLSVPAEIILYLGLFGGYYAATDGVLMALASAKLPTELRATGLAILTTTTSIGRFVGSVLFGLMWTLRGDQQAIWLLFAGLIVAILCALTIREGRDEFDPAPAGYPLNSTHDGGI